MTVYRLLMVTASADKQSYGITHTSAQVYRVGSSNAGRVHNPSFPHRLNVWDNTGRPNTEPERYSEHSGKPGPGKYLDPNRKGTDEPTSLLMSSESMVIDRYGTGTGTPGSGQMYAETKLTVGDHVVLVYFDDLTVSDEYVIVARPLSDPELVPVTRYRKEGA